jgi:hypothetical protein
MAGLESHGAVIGRSNALTTKSHQRLWQKPALSGSLSTQKP